MSPQERETALRYLKAFDTRGGENMKVVELLQAALSSDGKPVNEWGLHYRLYGKDRNRQFPKLKSELKKKIFETLLLDINLERKGALPAFALAKAQVMKKILLYNLLLSKGLEKECRILFQDIILLCRKYELYAELLEILHIGKYDRGFLQDIRGYRKFERQITFTERCYHLLHRAMDAFMGLNASPEYFTGSSQVKYLRQLKNSINELENENKLTRSALVSYYVSLLKFTYHHEKKEYEEARKICLHILEIIRLNPSVYLKRRMGIAYGHLNECCIIIGNYKRAAAYARSAQRYFPEWGSNYSSAKEAEFYALFYDGRWKEAEEAVRGLLAHSQIRSSPVRRCRWEYLLANALFKQGEFPEAQKLVSHKNVLFLDKTGWNTAIRIFTIMNFIEQRNYLGEAMLHIESLRKHLQRNYSSKKAAGNGKQTPHSREQIILRILRTLELESFDFNRAFILEKENLKLLAKGNNGLKWETLSPELIPFQEWFMKKVPAKKSSVIA